MGLILILQAIFRRGKMTIESRKSDDMMLTALSGFVYLQVFW